jgi:hypothetical protein
VSTNFFEGLEEELDDVSTNVIGKIGKIAIK